MGKVKNSKKHRKKLTQQLNPIPPHPTSSSPSTDTHNIYIDISSMDSKKREKACILLANIFLLESSNYHAYERMSNMEILGKLCIRLIDNVPIVRLHAAGAVRNMASCRTTTVSRRMVDAGIMGTLMSLVNEHICVPITDTSAPYLEQLVAAISNLCASCELAIDEILSKQFLSVLINALQLTSHVPSLKASVACCLYTCTDSHMASCEALYALPDAMGSLIRAATEVAGENIGGHDRLAQLYSVGTLSNVYMSHMASQESIPDALVVEARTRMQDVLNAVLVALSPSDTVFEAVIQPNVDDADSSVNHAGTDAPAGSSSADIEDDAMDEGEGDTGEQDDEGRVVYIGRDTEKPWATEFEVSEVAAEILANMACVLRNSMGYNDDINEEADWSDDDENELKMENMAKNISLSATNSASTAQLPPLQFDTTSAIGSCLSLLNKLNTALQVICSHCADNNTPFTSPGMDVINTADKVLNAMSNLIPLLDSWNVDMVSNTLLGLLQLCSSLYRTFNGVTARDDDSTKSSSELWILSPLLTPSSMQRCLRTTLTSCMAAIAALHRAEAIDKALISFGAQTGPYGNLKNMRLECLLNITSSVPLLEVMQPCFDIISALAEATDCNGQLLLHPDDNKVLTGALLARLEDPAASMCRNSVTQTRSAEYVDGSLLVMEGCISTLIDLHSSDDLATYKVFTELNTNHHLQEQYSNFRAKLRVDGEKILDRSDVHRCKEMLLNLKRFIKYKSTPPS
mmetsp:Transcript_15322/g.23072  ORF Transcript_15322/g.23072 Transcript_15322/m.23072 type:complete len:746 (-) Transcript_15322:81-2318(-)